MANKIDNVMDNIAAALATALVEADGSGVLKSITRGVIAPATVRNPPEMGLAISRLSRESTTWEVDGLMTLVANKGGVAADETITELVAGIDAAFTALIEAGTAGGSLDRPVWDLWASAANPTAPLALVGAMGGFRIRVQDPIKIET